MADIDDFFKKDDENTARSIGMGYTADDVPGSYSEMKRQASANIRSDIQASSPISEGALKSSTGLTMDDISSVDNADKSIAQMSSQPVSQSPASPSSHGEETTPAKENRQVFGNYVRYTDQSNGSVRWAKLGADGTETVGVPSSLAKQREMDDAAAQYSKTGDLYGSMTDTAKAGAAADFHNGYIQAGRDLAKAQREGDEKKISAAQKVFDLYGEAEKKNRERKVERSRKFDVMVGKNINNALVNLSNNLKSISSMRANKEDVLASGDDNGYSADAKVYEKDGRYFVRSFVDKDTILEGNEAYAKEGGRDGLKGLMVQVETDKYGRPLDNDGKAANLSFYMVRQKDDSTGGKSTPRFVKFSSEQAKKIVGDAYGYLNKDSSGNPDTASAQKFVDEQFGMLKNFDRPSAAEIEQKAMAKQLFDQGVRKSEAEIYKIVGEGQKAFDSISSSGDGKTSRERKSDFIGKLLDNKDLVNSFVPPRPAIDPKTNEPIVDGAGNQVMMPPSKEDVENLVNRFGEMYDGLERHRASAMATSASGDAYHDALKATALSIISGGIGQPNANVSLPAAPQAAMQTNAQPEAKAETQAPAAAKFGARPNASAAPAVQETAPATAVAKAAPVESPSAQDVVQSEATVGEAAPEAPAETAKQDAADAANGGTAVAKSPDGVPTYADLSPEFGKKYGSLMDGAHDEFLYAKAKKDGNERDAALIKSFGEYKQRSEDEAKIAGDRDFVSRPLEERLDEAVRDAETKYSTMDDSYLSTVVAQTKAAVKDRYRRSEKAVKKFEDKWGDGLSIDKYNRKSFENEMRAAEQIREDEGKSREAEYRQKAYDREFDIPGDSIKEAVRALYEKKGTAAPALPPLPDGSDPYEEIAKSLKSSLPYGKYVPSEEDKAVENERKRMASRSTAQEMIERILFPNG